MATVLVTGATGQIGGNICRLLAERGDRVRALVRRRGPADSLAGLGVELVEGDVTAAISVQAAAEGVECVIHSAAVLGGATQAIDEHRAVNVDGTRNVLDAAVAAGARRTVLLSTTTFFDAHEAPLTEHSPLDPEPSSDPYTVTKRLAYLDAMERVESGQDICVVISGAAFGPSPLAARAFVPPSWNQRALLAVTGDLPSYLSFPIPWVYAEDVAAASIAAMDRGVSGERYLAFGREADVGSIPFFGNKACEVAGVPDRVESVPSERLDDPDVLETFGPSLVALARKRFPEPFFRYELTTDRLGYRPRPLDEGLRLTLAWFEEMGLLG
jgi:dihydroflavonol-4-reductase